MARTVEAGNLCYLALELTQPRGGEGQICARGWGHREANYKPELLAFEYCH